MEKEIPFSIPRIEKRFLMSDCGGTDFILLQVLQHGLAEYEKPIPALITAYLAQNGGTVIDVGANTGLYSLLAASVASDIQVIAFEPLPKIFEILVANVEMNRGFAKRVQTVPLALSRRDERLSFYETVNDVGFLSTSSTLEKVRAEAVNSDSSDTQHYLTMEIETITLGSWSALNPISDLTLLKIDVEGHESAVLEGAQDVIAAHRPVIILEILPEANLPFLDTFLRSHNYVDFVLGERTLRKSASVKHTPININHVFCPREKIYPLVRAARAARLEIQ